MSVFASSQIWRNSKQKGSELLLLLALADFADDDGICWPSVETLSNKIRMTKRHTRKMLRELEEQGELKTRVNGGRKDCNLYCVHLWLEDSDYREWWKDWERRTDF